MANAIFCGCYFTLSEAKSFAFLRTFDGVEFPTYRAACVARHLLDGDQNWADTLAEASVSDSPSRMRHLFAVILVFCGVANPVALWEKYRHHLSEDFLRALRRATGDEVGDGEMTTIRNDHVALFSSEQKQIYDTVLESVWQNQGKMFFLDAPGGTGKTFVTTGILAEVRRQGKIAIAVASSGIAATLLPGLQDSTCHV